MSEYDESDYPSYLKDDLNVAELRRDLAWRQQHGPEGKGWFGKPPTFELYADQVIRLLDAYEEVVELREQMTNDYAAKLRERVAKLERTGRAFLEAVEAGTVRDYTTDERNPVIGDFIHPSTAIAFRAALDEGKPTEADLDAADPHNDPLPGGMGHVG